MDQPIALTHPLSPTHMCVFIAFTQCLARIYGFEIFCDSKTIMNINKMMAKKASWERFISFLSRVLRIFVTFIMYTRSNYRYFNTLLSLILASLSKQCVRKGRMLCERQYKRVGLLVVITSCSSRRRAYLSLSRSSSGWRACTRQGGLVSRSLRPMTLHL